MKKNSIIEVAVIATPLLKHAHQLLIPDTHPIRHQRFQGIAT